MRDSTHRAVLWEEAKGKLRAISATYENEREAFETWDKYIEEIITHVEDHGTGGFT
jgi:hypothetical protein